MAFTGRTGADWGGLYSRWTFDEAKAYLMVAKMRLEPGTNSGIPLLDAELNEQSEIFLQLLRRLAKRIYGDGTTNNGFKIIQSASNPNNNFTIMGGDGTLSNPGSIFVDGWMPVNPSNIEYTAQSYGPPAMTTPVTDFRNDTVYIDVYYEEIDRLEDGSIVDPTVNMETSRRIALRWQVKVSEGGAGIAPANYVDANNIQHWTMALAMLTRIGQTAQITTAQIVDTRNAGRLVSLASELTAHAALTNPHNATSAATANRLIIRDALGRAKIAAPSAVDDIARLDTVRSMIPAGSIMLFGNAAAPTGWTRKADWADNAMLCYAAAGNPVAGGAVNPQSAHSHVAPSHVHSGPSHVHSVPAHTHVTGSMTLTESQMPPHRHSMDFEPERMEGGDGAYRAGTGYVDYTNYTGGGASHNHGSTAMQANANTGAGGDVNTGAAGEAATTVSAAPLYQEVIAATKD
jgi:hypothetical protein